MFDNVKQSWQKKKGIHPTPTLYLEVGEFSLVFVKCPDSKLSSAASRSSLAMLSLYSANSIAPPISSKLCCI